MRRLVALAAAAAVVAAVPAEAKPLRYAGKADGKRAACAAKTTKKHRRACRRRARGWSARWMAPPLEPAPLPAPEPLSAPAAEGGPAGEGVPTGDTPSFAAPPAPAEEPPEPLCDPSPWLGAIAEDVDGFRLRLTRTCVPEGTVLFQFRNEDLAFHNLWAEGTQPARAAREVVGDTPGETMVTASETLAAGEWRLYCSLPGHEAMTRPVTVTPAG